MFGTPPRFCLVVAAALLAAGCVTLDAGKIAQRCRDTKSDELLCANAKFVVASRPLAHGTNLVCKGGFQDGQSCQTNADCREEAVCWQGPNNGQHCSTNFDCNPNSPQLTSLCLHNPTQVCSSDSDCPGVCEDDGASCSSDEACEPSACDGGINDGDQGCDGPEDCPGECEGPMAGTPCMSDGVCEVFLCSGTADPAGQGAIPCTGGIVGECEPVCNGGANHHNPCAVNADCPGGFCVTATQCMAEGECSDIGTCEPGNVDCEGRLCLQDWVICIGRGFCVAEDHLPI